MWRWRENLDEARLHRAIDHAAVARHGSGRTFVHLRPTAVLVGHVARPGLHEGTAMNAGSLKVVLVSTSYPRWLGDYAGQFIARVAEGLVQLGMEVHVVAPHEPGILTSEVLNGVRVRRFRYAPDALEKLAYGSGIIENLKRRPWIFLVLPAFVLSLRRVARATSRDADIVHAQWAQTALMLGRPSGSTKMVTTILGTDLGLAHKPLWAMMLRRALNMSDAVIAISDYFAQQLAAFMPQDVPLATIPVGLDAELLNAPVTFVPRGGVLDVICVGRVIESKGVFDLVRAFARVETNARLSFVGPGADISAAERLAADLGIADRVRFEGPLGHAETLARMGGADLVVSPSHREGFGATPAEAAAVGTATVVTRTGDMPLYTGSSDAVVEVGDVEGLARAMQMFLKDDDLRMRSARIGHSKVRELSWDNMARRTEKVYREIMVDGELS